MNKSIVTVNDLYKRYDQSSMMDSIHLVTDLVDKEINEIEKNGGNSKNIMIGGFSQGCALSLATFLMHKQQLGAVLGLSGMLALQRNEEDFDLDLKRKTPVFLYHGQNDPIINIKTAQLSYSKLDQYGIDYNLTVENGLEHSISIDEIKKISEFTKIVCE